MESKQKKHNILNHLDKLPEELEHEMSLWEHATNFVPRDLAPEEPRRFLRFENREDIKKACVEACHRQRGLHYFESDAEIRTKLNISMQQ